jgi:hypothetical protein
VDKAGIAACIGMDGWHHSRAELDEFPDPAEAKRRRVSVVCSCTCVERPCAIYVGTEPRSYAGCSFHL